MNFVPDPRWIELFPPMYIPIIIQDVLDAVPHLEPPPADEKRPEEFLSRQICRRLRRNKRYYTGPLTPNIEHWLTDLESRADIVFHCGKGQETYFVVEAKRLFVVFPSGRKASLVREYVDHGIMRFIDNRYAPYQQAAAMLAYVFTVSCQEAQAKIGMEVDRQRKKVCLQGSFGSSALSVKPAVNETRHLAGEKPFTLYHLFVDIKSH